MINTILQATEQFAIHHEPNHQANVPITVYENDAEYSNLQHTEIEGSSTSDESTEYQLELETSDTDYDPYPYYEVKRSLKQKICTRRESEGAGEIKNLFEPPKRYKLTVEEKKKNEIRKQRNRISANKSRLKRIAREKCLEKEADELEKEHNKLMKEVKMLAKVKRLYTCVYENHVPNCKRVQQAPDVSIEVKINQDVQTRAGEPSTNFVPKIKSENDYMGAIPHTKSSNVLSNDSYMANVSTLKRCGIWTKADQAKSARLDDKTIPIMMQAVNNELIIKSEPIDTISDSVSCAARRFENSQSSSNDIQGSITNEFLPTTSNCLFNYQSAPTTIHHRENIVNNGLHGNPIEASRAWTESSTIYKSTHKSVNSPQILLHDGNNQTKKPMTMAQDGLQTVLNDLNIQASTSKPNVGISYDPLPVVMDDNQALKDIVDFSLDEITASDFVDDFCLNEDEKICKIKSYLLEGLL